MHRTETIINVIVISGEIDMDMDNSTVRLKRPRRHGQRGTHHAWVIAEPNARGSPSVLIDATPLGIGHPVWRRKPPLGGAAPAAVSGGSPRPTMGCHCK